MNKLVIALLTASLAAAQITAEPELNQTQTVQDDCAECISCSVRKTVTEYPQTIKRYSLYGLNVVLAAQVGGLSYRIMQTRPRFTEKLGIRRPGDVALGISLFTWGLLGILVNTIIPADAPNE